MTSNLYLLNLLVVLHVLWAGLVVYLTILAFLGRLHGTKWLSYYAGALLVNAVFGSLLMHFPLQVAKMSAHLLTAGTRSPVVLDFLSGYATVVNDMTVFIAANVLMAAGFTIAFVWHLRERGMQFVNLEKTTLRVVAMAIVLIVFSTVPFIMARAKQRQAFDCTGLVDLNYLVEMDYLGSLPVDPVAASENGTGYEVMRKGHTIKISAPHAESGEEIWVRR